MSRPNPPFSLVKSNSTEQLIEELVAFFFLESLEPFEKRIVVVPDLATKEYLMRAFATHRQLQVAAGVSFLLFAEAVSYFCDVHIPSFLTLSLAIEPELIKQKELPRRIPSMSDELARLFCRYGTYAVQGLERWLHYGTFHWEKELWKKLFSEERGWTYPVKALREHSPSFSGKLALFGFSFLPLPHLDFFARLGCRLFLNSPSAHYWGDFLTHKEQLKSRVDPHLEHSLLGNWGRLHRAMLNHLDHFHPIEKENYEEVEESTLLGAIKSSFLNLEEVALPDEDAIEIHSAPSKHREIEALYETLLLWLEKEGRGSVLSDILVLVPEMHLYAPYIELVFGQTALSYSIEGLELASVSAVAQGIQGVLKLSEEEFEISSLFALLKNPAFSNGENLSLEEIGIVEGWMKKAEVRGRLDKDANSWEAGFKRLLFGCALLPQGDVLFQEWPLPLVTQTEIELFDRFLRFFQKITTQLEALKEEKTALEWVRFYLSLLEQYFAASLEREPLYQRLRQLRGSLEKLMLLPIGFRSSQRILQHCLQQKVSKRSGPELHQITFAPLNVERVLPHRCIVCLGMDEEAFPRSREKSSLDLLHAPHDYFPNPQDEDRACFLNLLVNASSRLIFSFERIHTEDHRAQQSSFLIDELDQWVEKRRGRGLKRIDHPARVSSEEISLPPFFSRALPVVSAGEYTVEIKELKKCARNPLQLYCERVLNVFLSEEEEEEAKPFLLSFLDLYAVKKEAEKRSVQEAFLHAKAEGKWPKGLFERLSFETLESEMQELRQFLEELDISSQDVQSFPVSLKVEGSFGSAHIVGNLSDIAPQGLLVHGKKEWRQLMRIWPLYLIMRSLFPERKELLCVKDGKCFEIAIENPQALLSEYLDYYFLAEKHPSLLTPDWTRQLLTKSPEAFAKSLREPGNDPYLVYLQKRNALQELTPEYTFWKEKVQKIFQPLVEEKYAEV